MKNILKNAVSTIKNWWIYLATGVLSIVVAFVVVFTPLESYVGLSAVFSFLVLFSGILTSYFSIANRKITNGWGWYLAGGIFETIAGIALISYPEISIALLATFIGFWLLFRATQMMANSIELRKYGVMDWGWLMALGVVVSIMSFFMIFDPIFGFFSVITLTFVSLLTAGISNIWLSLKLRKIKVNTIDVVKDIKKDIKKGLKNLGKEVDESIVNAISEETSNENGKADQYQSALS